MTDPAYQKQWKLDHPTYYNEYVRKPENKLKYNEIVRRKRLELITLLGGKCSNPECLVTGGCTDIRCLQIDHINGGGYAERKNLKGPIAVYYYYAKHPEEAKEKLQVLCANCNWIKKAVQKECRLLKLF